MRDEAQRSQYAEHAQHLQELQVQAGLAEPQTHVQPPNYHDEEVQLIPALTQVGVW